MNKKILIVRNDQEDAKALSFLLSGTGYRTSSHSTAKTALEAASVEHYDLAITDRTIPGNDRDLGFVSNLKQAQPKLPVFLLSEKHELDDVISCIRAGVTDIIDEPKNLKRVFEATNEFFDHNSNAETDVTWEDMLEVEQALSSLFKKGNSDGPDSDEAKTKRLNEDLEKALSRIGELERSNQNLQKSKEKAEALIADIKKSSDGPGGESADYVERQTQLKELEARLKERETKIAKQKAETEIMLSDLESRQFEIEENGQAPSGKDAPELQQKLDFAQMEWNGTRLDLEAQITDLNRELEQAKVSTDLSEDHQIELKNLKESLQQATEETAEKDFILDQRTKEIEKLKAQLAVGEVAIQTIEDLEEEKRLLEIERFKIQEKADKLEEDKHSFDDQLQRSQREVEVNKRDAEVSLRELQNRVKEEQLTLKVDQAAFKDESRQFEQAKQNFQEDIADLQSKQSELKQFEDQLNQLKSNLADTTHTLPRHTETAPKAPSPSSEDNPEVLAQPSATQANDAPPAPPAASDDKNKPGTWNSPPKNRKGNRGPLRIGGRPPSS